MMYEISDQGLASIAGALALAVMLCFGVPAIAADQPPAPANPSEESATPSAGAPAKSFTEEDVDKRVQEVIAERTKDGAFVFHDPKLDADLNLVFEQIKIVRGMEGYGWFANTIFHDKDEPKKQYAIDFWLKPEGDKLTLMDIRVQKGPKQEGDSYDHGHPHAGRMVVASCSGASWRHGGHPRLAGDELYPQLHRHA